MAYFGVSNQINTPCGPPVLQHTESSMASADLRLHGYTLVECSDGTSAGCSAEIRIVGWSLGYIASAVQAARKLNYVLSYGAQEMVQNDEEGIFAACILQSTVGVMNQTR